MDQGICEGWELKNGTNVTNAQMVRWMYVVTRENIIGNEHTRVSVKVDRWNKE